MSPSAATVNGVTISQSQLQDQLTTVSGSTVAQCALSIEESQSGGTPPPVAGTGDDTVSTQFAASQLNVLVAQTLEENELAARHQSVTAADIAIADLIRAVEGPLATVRGERAEHLAYDERTQALQIIKEARRINRALAAAAVRREPHEAG